MNTNRDLAVAIREAVVTRWPGFAKTPEAPLLIETIESALAKHFESEALLAADSKNVPPALESVTTFLRRIGSDIDPQNFMDFYNSNGWKVGKNPMKDWHAAARLADRCWERPKARPEPGAPAPLSEWERSKKQERLTELRLRLRELTNPGGSAYPVLLEGERRDRAGVIAHQIFTIQAELTNG